VEPVLTQEELEAIYSAMKADAGPQKKIDDYILASDHAYNMRCLQKWTEMGKKLLPLIESVFVGTLGVRGRVEIQDARIIDDEREQNSFISSAGMNEVIPLAQSDPDSEYTVLQLKKAKILLGIDRTAALKYVARRTATSSVEDEEPEERRSELTLIESRLLKDFYAEISLEIGKLKAENIGTPSITGDDPEDFWVDRVPRGAWANIRLASKSNPAINIWLRGPADLFLPLTVPSENIVKNELKSTKVELVMELGKLTMKAYDLWKLKPGEVYPLGVAVGEPLRIMVGGVHKIFGKPTVSRGHVAFEIIEPLRNRKRR
jgi:hypothetical protein